MESFHEAWDLICDYCKAHITDVAYKTWISRIEPVKLDFDAGDAILMVPNEFHRQTLNRCYMPLLNSAVHEIFGSGINIIFTIPNEAGEKKAAPNDNLDVYKRQGIHRGQAGVIHLGPLEKLQQADPRFHRGCFT